MPPPPHDLPSWELLLFSEKEALPEYYKLVIPNRTTDRITIHFCMLNATHPCTDRLSIQFYYLRSLGIQLASSPQ